MKQKFLNLDHLAKKPLVSRFLENPNQYFSTEEFNTLLDLSYEDFLSVRVVEQLNLMQFLSWIHHIDALNSLSMKLPVHQLQKMMIIGNNNIIHDAAYQGHLELLICLATIAPDLLQDMIKAGDYYVLDWVSAHGYVDVFKYLVKHLTPEVLEEKIRDRNYSLLRFAALNGRVEVLQYLVQLVPNLFQEMISAGNYTVFYEALSTHKISTVLYLDTCFPVEESNDKKLIKHIEEYKQEAKKYKTLVSNNVLFFKGKRKDGELDLISDTKKFISEFGAALISKEFGFNSAESVEPFLKLK